MRIHVGIMAVLAAVLTAGCSDDTVLKLTVLPGGQPAPAALRLAVAAPGLNPAPLRIAPVTLPGTVVVRGLPASAGSVCVTVDALDAGDAMFAQASSTIAVAAHRTTRADVTLDAPGATAPCSAGVDLGTGPDDLGTADLAGSDAAVPSCPASATFCDDFETGDTSRWSGVNIKKDLGSQLAVQTARAYHGTHALEAIGTGMTGDDNFVAVEKIFAPMAPPFALRAMVYTVADLTSFTLVMTLFDNSAFGFSFGGDNSTNWIITEEYSGGTLDHRSDMNPSTGGAWHCLEMVADAAGNVTGYVDGHPLIGPFARATASQYTSVILGISRTVIANVDVFVDDFAMGPSRLYCP